MYTKIIPCLCFLQYTIYNVPTEVNNSNHNFVMSTLEIGNIHFAREGQHAFQEELEYTCTTGHRDIVSSRTITITLLECKCVTIILFT